jgi:DNA (cytosine-5)-methyltransferase 1
VSAPKFRFVDLFAGIGGFHAALSAMGGRCVYAVEVDPAAASVYKRNWDINALGDITLDAGDAEVLVPDHDVLCAGFPCQPFSKSGAQKGMDETRGTLYWNILRVIEERRPAVVLLENVRNIAGPRHEHEWKTIVRTLRAKGYRVSETPAVFSPHLLPPERGGRPQVRERVFITATRLLDDGSSSEADPPVSNRPLDGWDPSRWDLHKHLLLDEALAIDGCDLSGPERQWIDAWDDFVQTMREVSGARLPGFPLWADEWVLPKDLSQRRLRREPPWKANYLLKNADFYATYRRPIDKWAKRSKIYTDAFPPSRRKFEWQAQDVGSLWETVMHFRPSGIRAKAPTYLPALVAITQTSIIGPRARRLSPREAARLQGLPDWFDFGDQPASATYRQLGNGVSVGAVWHVLRSHVLRDRDILVQTSPRLVRAVLGAPLSPDEALASPPSH